MGGVNVDLSELISQSISLVKSKCEVPTPTAAFNCDKPGFASLQDNLFMDPKCLVFTLFKEEENLRGLKLSTGLFLNPLWSFEQNCKLWPVNISTFSRSSLLLIDSTITSLLDMYVLDVEQSFKSTFFFEEIRPFFLNSSLIKHKIWLGGKSM